MPRSNAVIQLPITHPRADATLPVLRYLWGIVIRGSTEDPRAESHYSPVRPSRAVPLHRAAPRAFRRTLERVARLIPPERLLMMLVRGEGAVADPDVRAFGAHPVVQPTWRGTAPEVFLAALRIAREDPHATIALLPWERLVDHEGTFMQYVERAARAADVRPDLVLVIGAPAHRSAGPSTWIEPGEPVDGLETLSVRSVRRFVARPSPDEVLVLLERGALLATTVLVAKVSRLLALGRDRLPDVLETLEPLEAAAAGPEEDLLREAVYEWMPRADVASALGPRGDGFAVLPIPDFVEIETGRELPLAS